MRSSRQTMVCMLLLLCAATALTVSTYPVFDQTYDEPAHLAAGVQLLDEGRYDYELTHGPLARLAVAAGPYLDGARSHDKANIYDEGREILYCCGKYERTLTLARLGNLPFLILLIVVTYLWGRRVAGELAGLIAAFFVATIPPILGNSAIATTDLAAASTAVLALYALAIWAERPTFAAGCLFGAACGLAVASKLSAVPFLVVAIGGLLVGVLILQPRSLVPLIAQPRWQGYLSVLLGALVALWLAYGMRIAPISQLDPRADSFVDSHTGHSGGLHAAARFAVDSVPIPIYLVKLPLGVRWAGRMNERGHLSFLLGETSMRGWWYYYPVNLAVRTPIPLLLSGLAGLAWLGVRAWRTKSWQTLFPLAAFASILLFCLLFVRFNLGLRHVFILFPPLAIGAGFAVANILQDRAVALGLKVAVAAALAWQAITPVLAAPDQMTWFNAFAGSKPERILLVADLDWGQDLKRLKSVLQARHIEKVYLAYQGSADLAREGLPPFQILPENVPVRGWVAISLVKKARAHEGYAWLDEFKSVERVGRSIDLYYIEQPPQQPQSPQAPNGAL